MRTLSGKDYDTIAVNEQPITPSQEDSTPFQKETKDNGVVSQVEPQPGAPYGGNPLLRQHFEVPLGHRIYAHLRRGWAWEISGAVFSIASTVLIAAILIYLDNEPLEKWNLNLQPTTCVSILSAAAKTALLVPLTEGIGQLKWNYFEKPRVLARFQTFDEASRSPWGALNLLWHIAFTGFTAALPGLGAFLFLILLAFEPFVQQVISFGDHYAVMPNVTGTVPSVQAWIGNDYTSAKNLHFAMNHAVTSVIASQPLVGQTTAHCPSTECRFPDFTSIGICAACDVEAVPVHTEAQCIWATSSKSGPVANYTSIIDLQNNVKDRLGKENLTINMTCTKPFPGYPALNSKLVIHVGNDLYNTSDYTLSIFVNSTTNMIYTGPYGNAQNMTTITNDFTTSSNHAPQELHNVYANDVKDFSPVIGSFTSLHSITNFSLYNDISKFGQFNLTTTKCALNLCAQTFHNSTLKNGEYSRGQVTEHALQLAPNTNFTSLSGGNPTTKVPGDMPLILKDASKDASHNFTFSGWYFGVLETGLSATFNGNELQMFYLGDYNNNLTNGNYTSVFKDVASAMSDVLQSPANPTANITGEAYGHQVYVRIQWLWFSLPLLVLLLSLIFLGCTMFRSHGKKYMFKSSALAVLFASESGYGGQVGYGHHHQQQAVGMGTRETGYDLLMEAEGIRAVIERNEVGHWVMRELR